MKNNSNSAVLPPVIMTSAILNEGIEDLVKTIDNLYLAFQTSGELNRRRLQRLKRELKEIIQTKINYVIEKRYDIEERIEKLANLIWSQQQKPYSAINQKINAILKEINQR